MSGFYRAKYEYIILAVIIAASVAVSLGIGSKRDIVLKGGILQNELKLLRTLSVSYREIHGNFAGDFKELCEGFIKDDNLHPYNVCDGFITNKSGSPVDPFGNPYSYDKFTGNVTTTSDGFKQW